MKMNSRSGLSITEVLVASLLVALVVGGTLKIFTDSQKATTESLDSLNTSVSFDVISKLLQKSLATDSKIMVASSANITNRPEAGLPYSFPFVVSEVCRSLDPSTRQNAKCAQNYTLLFAKLGNASAAAICLARFNEVADFQNITDPNPNARVLVFDPAQSVYGQFSFSGTTGEIQTTPMMDGSDGASGGPTVNSEGTIQSVTTAMNLNQPMYLWIAPIAFGIKAALRDSQLDYTLIERHLANEKLPQHCVQNMTQPGQTTNTQPLIAFAIEPLFLDSITGPRPLNASNQALTYTTNYLDSNISFPARVGSLEIESLGFQNHPNQAEQYDFGISSCSLSGESFSCSGYPASISFNEAQSFSLEMSFSKRLGQDDPLTTSYKLANASTLTTTPQNQIGGFSSVSNPTQSSTSSSTTVSFGPETCLSPTCKVLPIQQGLQKLYDNATENEFTLSSNNYSFMKANHTRNLKVILKWNQDSIVKSKEVFLALP
jgi:hypothetical protein